MAGISQYFHSEEGEIAELSWVPTDDTLFYTMRLRGCPHRTRAHDYGSDIGIDPRLRPGDRVIYLRADPWCGIWIAPAHRYHPEFDAGFRQVVENRQHMQTYRELVDRRDPGLERWLDSLALETGVPVRVPDPDESFSEAPVTPATLFLSYSSRNVLAARWIFDYLRTEGRVDVWFDKDQAGESPSHEQGIADWLRSSVHECQILALLLTRAALASAWVRREIAYGQEKADRDSDFHFVLLKLEDVPLPELVRDNRRVVDCSGMNTGEILENLYAAVYRRESRREWLAEQKKRGWPGYEEPPHGYEHLASDSGEVRALHWLRQDRQVMWELDYESDGEVKTVRGSGANEIVDPGIRPGDKVGFFNLATDKPLWMRSDDLSLTANEVVAAYHRALANPPINRPGKLRPIRTCLAHTAIFFAIAAPGLLIGKFTFAREAPWWLIILLWLAMGVTGNLFETNVYRSFEGRGSAWWGTARGALTSVLMQAVSVVAAIAFLVKASGGLAAPWLPYIGGYLALLLAIHFVGHTTQKLHWERHNRELLSDRPAR